MRRPVRIAWRSGTLGEKLDECPRCGQIGRHRLERQYRWLEVGPIGVIPLGLRHGLECANCWYWTPMSWREMRRAMKARSLPLPDRPRPKTAEAVAAGGQAPDFDRVIPTRSLDGGTVYLGLWVVVLAILGGLYLQPKGIEGAHESGGTCLVVVGLAEGQPLPTPPMTVTDTLCVLPHNFEPVAKVPLTGFPAPATPPPFVTVQATVQSDCATAFKGAFGSPGPGGPVALITGVNLDDWNRGERFAWCVAKDPNHAWLSDRLPR